MPTLSYTVSDFQPFTKIVSADVNSRFNDIKTLLNTTKLDSTNVQLHGLTRDRMAADTVSAVVINDGSGFMTSEAQLATTRGGLGFAPTISAANVGKALKVNDAGNGIDLGSPNVDRLTQSLTGDVATLTCGEDVAIRDAVCLDLDASGAYRIFRCDATKGNRRTSFIGFATAAVTTTHLIQTFTFSADLKNTGGTDVVAYTINGRSYSTTFATSNDATVTAIAVQMATDPDVLSAAVTGGSPNRVITVTGKGALPISFTSTSVTGSTGPATITVATTQAAASSGVNIRSSGLLAGFSGLTPSALYSLSFITPGAVLSNTTDPSPVVVAQALSATVMWVKPPASQTFATASTFIRSHGSSANNFTSGVQDSEHFNFTSWSAGVSGTAGARSSTSTSSAAFSGYHRIIDGVDTSNNVTAQHQKYNKSAWASDVATTAQRGATTSVAFNSYLYVGKGSSGASLASGSGQQTNYKFNGTAWSATTSYVATGSFNGGFTQGGLLRQPGNLSTAAVRETRHETLTTSDVLSTDTAVPVACYADISGATASGGLLATNTTTDYTATYQWTGSWSASLATVSTMNSIHAAAYNAGDGQLYKNGKETNAGVVSAVTEKFNGATWASSTSSNNSRTRGQASVI